jgi:hypothetical protein
MTKGPHKRQAPRAEVEIAALLLTLASVALTVGRGSSARLISGCGSS